MLSEKSYLAAGKRTAIRVDERQHLITWRGGEVEIKSGPLA